MDRPANREALYCSCSWQISRYFAPLAARILFSLLGSGKNRRKSGEFIRLVKIILLAFAAIIVLCGAAFVVAGLLIPAERSFTNEVEINAPAEVVWAVVNDRDKYTEWQANLT